MKDKSLCACFDWNKVSAFHLTWYSATFGFVMETALIARNVLGISHKCLHSHKALSTP